MKDCFLVELDSVKFSETDRVKWIHAMSPGEYDHPLKGKIVFTPERIKRFAENVKARVRGIDLDIDYDHKTKTDEAAGWVQDAEAREDGLWLLVELTSTALQKVKDKAYRYFSPEYMDVWTHPKTGQKFTDVLAGGGLTNRPFLKDLTPINLSEVIGGTSMLEELRKLLSLPDDADEATILAKAQELKTASASTQDAATPPVQPEPQPVSPSQPEPANPAQPAVAPVVSTDPANDPVVAQLSERVMLLEAEKRHRTVADSVTRLSEGESFTVAPALLDEVRALALDSPVELSDKWLSLINKIKDEGIVQLGEVGSNPNPGPRTGSKSAIVSLHEQADALMLSEKLSFEDAVLRLTQADPDLARQYRNETFIKEGA